MSARVALPGTSTDTTVWTEADVDSLPGGWIGYVEVTSSQTGITSITDLSGLSVAVTVNASRRIRVTGHGTVQKNTNNGLVKLLIRESSTTLGLIIDNIMGNTSDVNSRMTGEGSVVLTPSAGTHTYKLSLSSATADADLSAASGDPGPAWLLVEDIGPA